MGRPFSGWIGRLFAGITRVNAAICAVDSWIGVVISSHIRTRTVRAMAIGQDGRVVYKSGIGPAGFKPPELETAIRTLVGR